MARSARKTKRPRPILWLVLLCFSQGAMYLTYFGLSLSHSARLQLLEETVLHPELAMSQLAAVWLFVGTWGVLGLASVVIGVGLRRGRPWAWTAAIILEGAILILALETYLSRRGDPLFNLAMAAAVGMTFLLNQRETQIFYRAHQAEIAEETEDGRS